ncbi:MAG TPA: alpha-2-macroglobulin family protein, partial [Blastocatellia bacterium]|nr:alpha-2-macroglobulin family protein [Blastocatellia bacterium]
MIPKRDIEQEKVEMIPSRKEYRPGDTAEILVQAPFYPAEGVVTLRRSGLVKTERFKLDEPSYTLRVPLSETYIPNIHVQVDLVGAAPRGEEPASSSGDKSKPLPKRPAFAVGELNLSIPAVSRQLAVTAIPRVKALDPGAETMVDVAVNDAAGKGVAGSEVAVVVVDEAVLALTGYKLIDPLGAFYASRGDDTSDYHLRQNVVLASAEELFRPLRGGDTGNLSGPWGLALGVPTGAARDGELARMQRAMPSPPPAAKPMIADGFIAEKKEGSAEPIRMRTDFNALAVFVPAVPTDANGRAEVKVKVPDNLTRYRIMAVSVAGGKQFGSGESAITARLPLMVRPSAPRFLNFGDRFELPVVVQNQTDEPMEVNVAVRASNAQLTEGAGRRVAVPANDRVEVRFPTTTLRAGTARFQIAGVSGPRADAAEVELPVWTPATTEAFATYGEIDKGAIVQPVKSPPDVVRQFGGLEITESSTQLQALTDAVLYLVAYPYECSEQLSSRILAVSALRDVLAAFKAQGLPPTAEIEAAVKRDVKRLSQMQNGDGGFGFWRRGDESWPYLSIHVAHALQRAKEKNFDVPQEMLDRSKNYLKNIESHYPAYYSPECRRALTAYALYVRNRMGDRDAARARRLIAEAGLDKLSLEAVGWLLPVLSGDAASRTEVAAIRSLLNNRAEETAGTAHFTTSYSD